MEVNRTYGSLKCVYYELNFSSKEEMMFHLLTHNVVKPFICLECKATTPVVETVTNTPHPSTTSSTSVPITVVDRKAPPSVSHM